MPRSSRSVVSQLWAVVESDVSLVRLSRHHPEQVVVSHKRTEAFVHLSSH